MLQSSILFAKCVLSRICPCWNSGILWTLIKANNFQIKSDKIPNNLEINFLQQKLYFKNSVQDKIRATECMEKWPH